MKPTIYLEDLAVGQTFVSSRVTITETHIVWFAGLTGDFNPLHMDAETAKETAFGRTIAHGMLSHAMSTGMRSAVDQWAMLAFLETRRKFMQPVFAGDTLHYLGTVLEARNSSSRNDRGIVRVGISLRKQDESVVQEGEDVFAIFRKVSA